MQDDRDDVTQDWVADIGRPPVEGEEWLPRIGQPPRSDALAALVQPDSPPPDTTGPAPATALQEETERLPGGRHRADTAPITGPLHRVPRAARGMHQQDKTSAGPWVLTITLTIIVLLSVWGAYQVGQWAGADARDTEWIKRPLETVTVTPTDDARPASAEAGPRPKAKPVPTVTKTVTRTQTRTAAPAPAPTVTRWQIRPGPTRTVRAPAPTVTRTVTRTSETCYEVSGGGEYLGMIPCP